MLCVGTRIITEVKDMWHAVHDDPVPPIFAEGCDISSWSPLRQRGMLIAEAVLEGGTDILHSSFDVFEEHVDDGTGWSRANALKLYLRNSIPLLSWCGGQLQGHWEQHGGYLSLYFRGDARPEGRRTWHFKDNGMKTCQASGLNRSIHFLQDAMPFSP